MQERGGEKETVFFRILSKTSTIAIISPLVKETKKLSEKSQRMSAHKHGLSIAVTVRLRLRYFIKSLIFLGVV